MTVVIAEDKQRLFDWNQAAEIMGSAGSWSILSEGVIGIAIQPTLSWLR